MKKTILILAAIVAALSSSAQITTRIKGRIIGDAPKQEMLMFGEFNQDFRIKPADAIQIEDGRFSYEWTASDTTAFTICFLDEYLTGSWKEYTVFSEGGTLNIAIGLGDPDMDVSEDGLTKQFYALRKEFFEVYRTVERMKKDGNYYTAEAKELLGLVGDESLSEEERNKAVEKINGMMRTKEALTPEAREIELEKGTIYKSMTASQDSIIGGEANPLGLLFLADNILRNSGAELSPETLQTFDRYEAAYPEHTLAALCRTEIISNQINKNGGQIPNLKARDLDGNEVCLRSLINSKITLLDLWASWCGPCRRHSKELIPVYEEFKDRGFSVLAVAREYKDTDAMKKAMEKDGYPWPSYVDLGDEFQVWQQMGAGNAGGAIFLLNSKGRVIKSNPTADEVREFLEKIL